MHRRRRTFRSFALRLTRLFSPAACWSLALLAPGALSAETTPLAHVETVGEGQTQLILIPGWMCDWSVWDEFMQRNADRYTMRAVTLPGFVGADPPEDDELNKDDCHAETPWLNNAVAAVAELIEAENIQEPVVIGHSLGGQIAMRLAIERPELVGKVVTVDGMPAVPLKYETGVDKRTDRVELVKNAYEPWFRAMSAEDWTAKFDRAVDNLVETAPHRAQLHRMFNDTEREPSMRYLVEALKTDITPEIEEIRAPLLAIAAIEDCPRAPADFDESICAVWHEQLAQAPDAQLVFFQRAKHFFFLTQTVAFDNAINRFIEGKPVESHNVDHERFAGRAGSHHSDRTVRPDKTARPAKECKH